MPEFAVLRGNKVINIITTVDMSRAVRTAERMDGMDVTVKPIEKVSIKTLEGYQYWNERP